MNILESIQSAIVQMWNGVKGSSRELPGMYMVPPSHTDLQPDVFKSFEKDKTYFQVRVNEMYLSYDRQWFSNYEPMLFTATEFLYGGERHTVPTLVGPQLMPKLPTGELPARMVFANTRVAGLHPYRGGRLVLTVILYRSERDNVAQSMLKLIENTAGALDFTHAVDIYVKVATVALDGIQALLGLGKLQPLLGIRREFDPDADALLMPGYYVLCNRTDLDETKMWVKEGKWLYGDDLASAASRSGDDYVLYSVVQTPERSDADALPFYSLYQQAKQQATQPTKESWDVAKANLAAVHQMMVTSPDLTPEQASALLDAYLVELKSIHDRATRIASLAPTSRAFKQAIDKAYDILQMQ
jgi:hypothetical protein